MKYVLDTNALSLVMRGHGGVLARLRGESREEIAVPQPALAEIEYGIERLPKSKRKRMLRDRFELVRSEIDAVPWSDEVSRCFGEIKAALERKGQLIEDFDIAIAAHALAHGAVLVTANLVHMVRVPGLMTEDWSQ